MKLAAFIFALPPPVGLSLAHADALDGDWCSEEGEKLTINGDLITTPSGQTVEGVYGRHRFQYTAPEGDWKAGMDIDIRQRSDTLMMLKAGEEPVTEWGPCEHIS